VGSDFSDMLLSQGVTWQKSVESLLLTKSSPSWEPCCLPPDSRMQGVVPLCRHSGLVHQDWGQLGRLSSLLYKSWQEQSQETLRKWDKYSCPREGSWGRRKGAGGYAPPSLTDQSLRPGENMVSGSQIHGAHWHSH
jgi:hypothetical protein